jgi:hypothetical protein
MFNLFGYFPIKLFLSRLKQFLYLTITFLQLLVLHLKLLDNSLIRLQLITRLLNRLLKPFLHLLLELKPQLDLPKPRLLLNNLASHSFNDCILFVELLVAGGLKAGL